MTVDFVLTTFVLFRSALRDNLSRLEERSMTISADRSRHPTPGQEVVA
ncbi:hypothetical protein REH65_01155 [Saccharopolyspora sp. ID03-671]